MCTLEKLNFKISWGSIPPDPPSTLALSALDIIFAGLTLKCFRRACYFQSIILSIILRIFVHKKMFLFSVAKGAPSVLYRDIYFKDCRHEVRSSLKCTPPPRQKGCVRACHIITISKARSRQIKPAEIYL